MNWILYAAQGGFVYAQYRLARELLDKRFVAYDAAKAKRWLTAAAEQGHFRAIRDLTTLLIEQQDYAAAQIWLEQGLKQDDEHPDLWLSQAKLLTANGDAKAAKAAKDNAIAQAEDRGWYLIVQ